MMQGVGGYNPRNYNGTPRAVEASRLQSNEFQVPPYLNMGDDEFGDLPLRVERRLPTSLPLYEEGIS